MSRNRNVDPTRYERIKKGLGLSHQKVLEHWVAGDTYAEIAGREGVKVDSNTVRIYVGHIYDLIESYGEISLRPAPGRPRNRWAALRWLQGEEPYPEEPGAGEEPDPEESEAKIWGLPRLTPSTLEQRQNREEVMEELLANVMKETSEPGTTAIWGMPGIGKTVLAQTLCSRDEIRERFLDGMESWCYYMMIRWNALRMVMGPSEN